ncbi:transketolase [Buchnera aphidicola (Mollitrichosiphum nigrofasciatum)]|uniref:transketolase n=1 Tax=Buchnera aphidicola TaxID=9 RepID=UPI0031B835B6
MYSNNILAHALRMLSIDAVQKANSGHPGAPMGMADIATILWRKFIKHNPANPLWANRDRFILSNGHASILLYSILHLTGYNISIKELKNFRQLYSQTPGHPEVGCTPGVEITTGPLGQGLGNAVGMAISERILSECFNRKNHDIVDHYTWVFVGDGCLMEGISHEVCSLAGSLKLEKLIVLYDSNGISIDGNVKKWFNDDTEKRFLAYNWNVISHVNGHDPDAIYKAITAAKLCTNKPSIIIFNTIIGFGSPNKCGNAVVHGSPLGKEEITLVRKNLDWEYPAFEIPKFIYDKWQAIDKGKILENKWLKLIHSYKNKYPKLYFEYKRRIKGNLPSNWNKIIKELIYEFKNNTEVLSTRQISQNILEFMGSKIPELIGGSADLTPSNLTKWSGSKDICNNYNGNYIHYGVREFGMTAIANGMAHYKGFIPYIATFLMFSDYARNGIRMAALMKTRNILIYTHDSIGLGEDGPTHQPIEQLSTLRLIPNLSVWRPCNKLETVIAWKMALERTNGPTALILSRQNLSFNCDVVYQEQDVCRGAYILKDFTNTNKIHVIIISTGSEIQLALDVAKKLYILNFSVRVVSMPSCDVFDNQSIQYKNYIFPKYVDKYIVIEAGVKDFWYKYVGLKSLIIGIDTFAESAPAVDLFKKFGFSVNSIVKKSKLYLAS